MDAILVTLLAGFMVDFISAPVTSGFISATSVIIIVAQLQGLLGLKFKSANTADNLYKLLLNVTEIRPTDITLGICSMIFLLIFRVSSVNYKFIIYCEVLLHVLYF